MPSIGKDGEQGAAGKDGSVVAIGDNGNWYIDGKDTKIPARGKDGEDGLNGTNGKDADIFINTDGYWVINGKVTDVMAKGQDGTNGKDAVVTIDSNGYWVINGKVTEVKAKGEDGQDAQVSINSDGYWVINGTVTEIKAVGQDGQDGSDGQDGQDGQDGTNGKDVSVYINDDGFWVIDGEVTNVKAKGENGQDGQDGADGADGLTPVLNVVVGENGNWYINGIDTGIAPAGKSAYEIWKESVSLGEIENKDGTPYTGGDTLLEYYKWLQGGNISSLYIHWRDSNIINKDKTMDDFLTELFDCHCDGISLSLEYNSSCNVMDAEGKIDLNNVASTATLTVDGDEGTVIKLIDGDKVVETKTITNVSVFFTIPQEAKEKAYILECEIPNKKGNPTKVTKNISVAAWDILEGVKTKVENVDDSTVKMSVTITDKSDYKVLTVDGKSIFDAKFGWVTEDSKTYSKEIKKTAKNEKLRVHAETVSGACSYYEAEIPQLSPVEAKMDPKPTIDNCSVVFTLVGTPKMKIEVAAKESHTDITNKVTVYEDAGTGPNALSTYTISVPRKFKAYTVQIDASLEGRGTFSYECKIKGEMLLSKQVQLIAPLNDVNAIKKSATTFKIKNTASKESNESYVVEFSRAPNTDRNAIKRSAFPTQSFRVNAGETLERTIHRDYNESLQYSGEYRVKAKITNTCGESFELEFNVLNQGDFTHYFKKYPDDGSGEGGSGEGNPNEKPEVGPNGKYRFDFVIEDAVPDVMAQLGVTNSSGTFTPVSDGVRTNVEGKAIITFELTRSQLDAAWEKPVEINLIKDGKTICNTKGITFKY